MKNKVVLILFLLGFSRSSWAQEDENVFQSPLRYTTKKIEKILKLRNKAHRWEHIVRGFRKEHHFALATGLATGEWHLGRVFDRVNERRRSSALSADFRYSFHLSLYKSFGYYLGTSFGYQLERDVDEEIDPPKVIRYPGIAVGFVHNFSPVVRLRSGVNLFLERWDDFGIKEADETKSLSVTTRVLEFSVACDIFYDLYWGVSIGYLKKRNYYQKPADAENFPVDADLAKAESQISLSVIYHLM